MRAGKTVLVVAGAVAVLVGFAATLAGGTLLWAHGTQRDADGYYSTSRHRFETGTYAVASEHIDLAIGAREGDWVRFDDVGRARAVVRSVSDSPVFVGIAPDADVERYLRNSAHDELNPTSPTPIMSADALAAVRFGFRMAFSRASRPAPAAAAAAC